MDLENVRHIPQVMNGVVQQIAAEGFDRKLGPIAAKAHVAPLGARHGIEAVGHDVPAARFRDRTASALGAAGVRIRNVAQMRSAR